MLLIALAYFVAFGIALLFFASRYLWDGQDLNLTCPSGMAKSACLIKRALKAMGRVASGIVLAVAFLIALYAMVSLYLGNSWALVVLTVLGLLAGMSVAVQMRERGLALAKQTPWRVAMGLTLGVPAVSVVASL